MAAVSVFMTIYNCYIYFFFRQCHSTNKEHIALDKKENKNLFLKKVKFFVLHLFIDIFTAKL